MSILGSPRHVAQGPHQQWWRAWLGTFNRHIRLLQAAVPHTRVAVCQQLHVDAVAVCLQFALKVEKVADRKSVVHEAKVSSCCCSGR